MRILAPDRLPSTKTGTMTKPSRFSRPTIVVSRCLCGARCRWDGDSCRYDLVKELKPYARVIPVCPEMEIGLGVPRDRIVLVRRAKGVELYQQSTGLRLAQKMNSFAHRFLTQCGEVDGFILKHKSPSCGLRSVKLYASTATDAAYVRKGVGLFAADAIRQLPHVAFDDEERLDDSHIREHFLTKVFTLAAWRAVRKRGSAESLKRFHEYHRMSFSVYSQRIVRDMDRLITSPAEADLSSGGCSGCVHVSGRCPHLPTSLASSKSHRLGGVQESEQFRARQMPTSAGAGRKSHPQNGVQIFERYEALLHRILQKPPRRTATIVPLELALEHYSPFLSATDHRGFRNRMQLYLDKDLPLSDLRKTVQVWAVRYDKNFIRMHSFFRPYPGPLAPTQN